MIVVEETLNKKWNWWPLFPLYPYGKKKTILKELIPDQIWSLEQIQGLYYVAVPIRTVSYTHLTLPTSDLV